MEQSLQVLSKQEPLEQWSGKIAVYCGSGVTVRAWCQKHGIPEKTYYSLAAAAISGISTCAGAG